MIEELKKNEGGLSADELNKWLTEFKNTQDGPKKERIRNFIVIACMPLVRKIAHGLARRNTDPIEDIIQVGSLGLVKAIDFFDFSLGTNFRAYASYLITGEIRHYLRDKVSMIKPPRELQELAFRVNQIAAELALECGEKPTDKKLSEILQMPINKVSEVFEFERRKQTVSLDQLVAFSDDDKLALSDRISSDDIIASSDFQETKILIKAALDKLDPDSKQIVEMVFYDDLSQREISERLNVSQMHVSRKLKQAMALLFKIIYDEDNPNPVVRNGDNDNT